jgi:large subunit ribosomal protein L21
LGSYIATVSKYEIKTMSFAVIQTGGKQYKVSASEILKIERLADEEGKTIEFKNVLFLNDDKSTEIGNPNIKGAKVEATVLKNTKNRTVLVFKKRRRKNSRKKYGHRQPVSLVRITKIYSKDGKLIAEAEPRKIISQKIVKGNKERKKQEFESKKTKDENDKKVKKALKKVEMKAKKPTASKEKKDEKKTLTSKKK